MYTDHASLLTVVNSPHLLQRMSMWLSFFAAYKFYVKYKPGRLSVISDALSRRPDFESPAQPDTGPTTVELLTLSVPSSTLLEDIRKAYNPEIVSLFIHLNLPEDPKPAVGGLSILNRQIYSLQRLTDIFSSFRRHASCRRTQSWWVAVDHV